MAETKWMPGPWEVSSLNMHRQSFQVSVRAQCNPHPKTAEGTACLIGAAPDLARELAACVCGACGYRIGDERPGPGCVRCDRARAALARARGES